MSRLGFTGTRSGMTEAQKWQLETFLRDYASHRKNTDLVFHHGDCIGADAEAHTIAKKIGFRVCVHPSTLTKQRAWCEADEYREAKPP